jgi:hypothetical protein
MLCLWDSLMCLNYWNIEFLIFKVYNSNPIMKNLQIINFVNILAQGINIFSKIWQYEK